MNTRINKQQWQEEEALRRFQLISPLLQADLDDAKRIQLRKKIAEENHISVRSLYQCIVAKNRHGETGTVKLQWLPQFTTFADREWRHDEG